MAGGTGRADRTTGEGTAMTRSDQLIKYLERELERERSKRQELEERCRRYAAIINRIAPRKRG